MATRPTGFRIAGPLLEELAARSRELREPESLVARRLLEEGPRMKAHPGIEFRDGPTGRRASVVGGPDVWEIIPVVTDSGTSGEEAVKAIVEHMDLTPTQARAALRYYAAYPDEINWRIRSNNELAELIEAAWLREQAASGR